MEITLLGRILTALRTPSSHPVMTMSSSYLTIQSIDPGCPGIRSLQSPKSPHENKLIMPSDDDAITFFPFFYKLIECISSSKLSLKANKPFFLKSHTPRYPSQPAATSIYSFSLKII